MRAVSSLTAIAIENVNYYGEVRRFIETLRKKIESATSSLRKSNRQLQKMDVAKDEFINIASHQLRTPLTSIKGYASMILDGDAGGISPLQKRFMNEVYDSSNKMVRIVNDFLNVSRIDFFRNDQTSASKLQMPAIRLNLSPKRFLRLRYLSDTILKRFIQPMIFSLSTRSDETWWLKRLSSFVSFFLRLRLMGRIELA